MTLRRICKFALFALLLALLFFPGIGNASENACGPSTFTCAADGQCAAIGCGGCNTVTGKCLPLPPPPPIATSFSMPYLVYPLVIAAALLALAYMASRIFSLPHWGPIIADELWQVVVTGGVVLLLVGMQLGVNDYLTYALEGTGETVVGVPQGENRIAAIAYEKLGNLGTGEIFIELQNRSAELGGQASKGIYCSMLGVGFTLVNCSPLNAFRGALTSAAFTTMVGMVDIYTQQFILSLALNYSFSLLIPFGLFFRCFKASRQAGGALIAIGFGFYTVYPLVIVATDNLLVKMNAPLPHPEFSRSLPAVPFCDPYELNADQARQSYDTFAAGITAPELTLSLTYTVLVRTIFMSILNLIITLGFISAFARLVGSEIDVSGLARIS